MIESPEKVDFDILFVGGGPANLAAAIHLQQLVARHNLEGPGIAVPEIAVIEKGRYSGAHLLSGAIVDTRVMEEFIPAFREEGCPLGPEVTGEELLFLTRNKQFPFPFIPESFSNRGNHLVSLSRFGAWLAARAEKLGVVILDHTAAASPVIEEGAMRGIMTDDKGRSRDGSRKPAFEPGMMFRAPVTVIGEGGDGSLFNQLDSLFRLKPETVRQTWETGVKEMWRIPEGRLQTGTVMHTFGYPLSFRVYGGGWLYAFSPTELSLGFATSLGPSMPHADPHFNLQRFKQHPLVSSIISGGTVIEYGVKTITSGGLHAMARLFGPGFLITGESAGLVNMQRQKGVHLAIKSGLLAAETLFQALLEKDFSEAVLKTYSDRFHRSWAYEEMHASRNYRDAFDAGLYKGLLHAGLSTGVPGLSLGSGTGKKTPAGKGNQERERELLEKSKGSFQPDNTLTFSKENSLYHSGTSHEEDQPCHLVISRNDIEEICLKRCVAEFGNPCMHFCPAKVYEPQMEPVPVLRLNPSNCLHCKTCEIADPYGIILWTVPEGGGGPGYKIS